MTYPTRVHLRDCLHARDVLRRMPELDEDLGIDPIHCPDDDHSARLPDEPQDNGGDEQTNDGVGQWVPKPDPESTSQDR